MVPISLYVTIALVKVAQAKLMEWDLDMSIDAIDDATGQHKRSYMKVKAAALNEELGIVDVICSDKTGTLTQNKMELSRCSVAAQLYYDKESDYQQHKVSQSDHKTDMQPNYLRDLCENAYRDLIEPGTHASNESKQLANTQRHFILCILLCNGVLPATKQQAELDTLSNTSHNDTMNATDITNRHITDSTVIFQSQSPDEIALCESLHRCGITMLSRTGNNISIRIQLSGMKQPLLLTYNVLATLDFSSVWRRMSVVVQDKYGAIHLYSKGADSTIHELIDMNAVGVAELWRQTDIDAGEFAVSGSRTLMFSGRSLTQSEYDDWYPLFNQAQLSMSDREAHIERSFRAVEHHMDLLGCSAVDDQLQLHVPECIDFLLAAGLKIIVVTGDKKETAVTIARQSHLIHQNSRVLYLTGNTRDQAKESLNECLIALSLSTGSDTSNELQTIDIQNIPTPPNDLSNDLNKFTSLAVDGICLELLLAFDRSRILRAFTSVHSIVCYRSTPLQKAMVVRLVKKDMQLTTLAIGDGANDVSMILEAHVGVGILGKEGAHAAMSSDFVIHRFSHLKKLLFVHGRNNYFRLIQVVLFTFYKNLAYQLPLFWFEWWSLGSGTTFFDSILQTCWNLFFTSVPPFFIGCYDIDVRPHVLLRIPQAYQAFKNNNTFKLSVFMYILLISFYQSLVTYFIAYAFYYNNEILSNGQGAGLYYVGHTILTSMVITVNLWMLVSAEHINLIMVFGVLFMWCWYTGVFLFVNQSYQIYLAPAAYGTGILFTEAGPWLIILCVVVASLIPDTLLMSYRKLYKPYAYEQLQRLENIDIKYWPLQLNIFEPFELSEMRDTQHSLNIQLKSTSLSNHNSTSASELNNSNYTSAVPSTLTDGHIVELTAHKQL